MVDAASGTVFPEYRTAREKAGGFLDLCFNPKLAAEVTLQPVRRFAFDAAILFSDILVVALALGRKVEFLAGEGPKLEALRDADALSRMREVADQNVLAPIYETVRQVKTLLDDKTALIGFCGAPWTVATYIVAGQATPDQAPARLFAHRDPENFSRLIDRLVGASIDYLANYFRQVPIVCRFSILGLVCSVLNNSTAGALLQRKKSLKASVGGYRVPRSLDFHVELAQWPFPTLK